MIENKIVESNKITIVPTEKLDNQMLGSLVKVLLEQHPSLNILEAIQLVASSLDIINCMDLVQQNGTEITVQSSDNLEWVVTIDLIENSEIN